MILYRMTMNESDLFDSIVTQLLSGHRKDGVSIDFRYKLIKPTRVASSISDIKYGFISALRTAGPLLTMLDLENDADTYEYDGLIGTIMDTLPITNAIHGCDRDYFESLIWESCKTFGGKQETASALANGNSVQESCQKQSPT